MLLAIDPDVDPRIMASDLQYLPLQDARPEGGEDVSPLAGRPITAHHGTFAPWIELILKNMPHVVFIACNMRLLPMTLIEEDAYRLGTS